MSPADRAHAAPRRRSPFLRRLALSGAGLAILLGVAVVRSVRDFAAEEARLAVFEPHLAAYLAAADADEVDGTEGIPEVAGKLVIVHAEARRAYGWAMKMLPAGQIAATPEEVGTVVVVRPEWERVGHYVDESTGDVTKDAWRGHVEVTLVAWPDGRVVASRRFEGAMPRERITEDMSGAGGLPMWDVLEWLEDLPRG